MQMDCGPFTKRYVNHFYCNKSLPLCSRQTFYALNILTLWFGAICFVFLYSHSHNPPMTNNKDISFVESTRVHTRIEPYKQCIPLLYVVWGVQIDTSYNLVYSLQRDITNPQIRLWSFWLVAFWFGHSWLRNDLQILTHCSHKCSWVLYTVQRQIIIWNLLWLIRLDFSVICRWRSQIVEWILEIVSIDTIMIDVILIPSTKDIEVMTTSTSIPAGETPLSDHPPTPSATPKAPPPNQQAINKVVEYSLGSHQQ